LKPETEFYAEKTCKDGLRPDCKACHSNRGKAWYAQNREKAIAYVKRWQQDNPERLREYRLKNREKRALQMRGLHLRRTFGMTIEEYGELLAAQGGGCAICGDEPINDQSLHIDHDHDVVRGILCVRCNNGLGQFKEDPDLLIRAAEYALVGGFTPLWRLREGAGGGKN
jgi:hypothetical protein